MNEDNCCRSCLHRDYCVDRLESVKSCTGYEQGAVPRIEPMPGWESPLAHLNKVGEEHMIDRAARGLVRDVELGKQIESEKELGRKHDLGKLRWDLVQPLILQEYVKVLTFGARKYAPNNWRLVADHKNRYFAALLRHLWAWMFLGERDDPESGLHHLGHAMCCLTFLAEPELEGSAKPLYVQGMNDPYPDAKPCPDCGSTSGKCVIGTECDPPLSEEDRRDADAEAQGKQLAVELTALEQHGPGVISKELGCRLLSHYGWTPIERGGWKHPFQHRTMPLDDALREHGYRLAAAEDMVESDHELHADPGRVRESGGQGPSGSGGQPAGGS